jgi:hypothetical protein
VLGYRIAAEFAIVTHDFKEKRHLFTDPPFGDGVLERVAGGYR